MATTANITVDADGWTELHTATTDTTRVSVQISAIGGDDVVLLRVASSDPGSGDAEFDGSLVMRRGRDPIGIDLDDGDVLWARSSGAATAVTVLA